MISTEERETNDSSNCTKDITNTTAAAVLELS